MLRAVLAGPRRRRRAQLAARPSSLAWLLAGPGRACRRRSGLPAARPRGRTVAAFRCRCRCRGFAAAAGTSSAAASAPASTAVSPRFMRCLASSRFLAGSGVTSTDARAAGKPAPSLNLRSGSVTMFCMAVAPEASRVVLAPAASETAEQLFQEHSGWIYGYCLRLLRSPEEAEDALQTTYLNACRSLNRGTRPQVGSAWLLRIAQNVCFARMRSSGRRGKLERVQDITILEETVAAPERSPRRSSASPTHSAACPSGSARRSSCASGRASRTSEVGDPARPEPGRGRDADLPRAPIARRRPRRSGQARPANDFARWTSAASPPRSRDSSPERRRQARRAHGRRRDDGHGRRHRPRPVWRDRSDPGAPAA